MSILLSTFCPVLNATVTLTEEIWKYKILHDHEKMQAHLKLVEDTLKEKNVLLYRKQRDPTKLAIFKETAYFLPYNKFLKIALETKDERNAIITTAHACYNIPTDMERL